VLRVRLRIGVMPTIDRHRRPAELERQQCEQKNCKPTAHRRSLAAAPPFRRWTHGAFGLYALSQP
jgi:hypothetical protein